MHTLHNQEIQRISPRNPKIYHREIQKCSLSWGGGFKLMHTLHNHESKEFHKEIKKHHREIQTCSLSWGGGSETHRYTP